MSDMKSPTNLDGEAFHAAEEIDWQRLWLATQRRPWTSLALIPVGADIPTPRIAAALAEVGRHHLGQVILSSDETGMTLGELEARLCALAQRKGCAERVILALPEVRRSPVGLALAQAADAAVLCVALGSSAISEAEQVIDEVGKERFLGSVIVRGTKEKR